MSQLILVEQTTPSTPDPTKVRLYPKSDGNLYKMSDNGVEEQLALSSGDMQKAVYDTNNISTDVFNFATAMALALG